MAREFLWRGHRVAVCGRDPEGVERAVAALDEGHERGRVVGLVCDVGDYEQVRALWDAAVGRFGEVDVWINNAGVGDTGATSGSGRSGASRKWSGPTCSG